MGRGGPRCVEEGAESLRRSFLCRLMSTSPNESRGGEEMNCMYIDVSSVMRERSLGFGIIGNRHREQGGTPRLFIITNIIEFEIIHRTIPQRPKRPATLNNKQYRGTKAHLGVDKEKGNRISIAQRLSLPVLMRPQRGSE